MRVLLSKYQSLIESILKADFQGKYRALKAVLSYIKDYVQGKYQAAKAVPSNIKTSLQNKYQSFKDSLTRKKNYLVHQYKRFRDSRFIKVSKSIFKFLRSYALPISTSFMLTGVMSTLRMPTYMILLQNIGDPVVASFALETGLLIPALIGTKAYRVIKALHQKHSAKPQDLPERPQPDQASALVFELAQPELQQEVVQELALVFELPQPAVQQEEVHASALLEDMPQPEAQIEDYQNSNQFTTPDFTTVRSNLKHNKRSASLMLADIDEEQDENDSGVDIDALRKSLKQSWSFQDKEPKAQAPVLVLPEVQQQSPRPQLQDPLAVHPAAILPLRSILKRRVSFDAVDYIREIPAREVPNEPQQESAPVVTRSSSSRVKRSRAEPTIVPIVLMADESLPDSANAPDANSNKRRRSSRNRSSISA
jgi:hypothetical protein